MEIKIIPAKSLNSDHRLAWSQIQNTNPSLASPFFCHEFTSAVAAVRNDVWVGLIIDAREIIGFFPFQRGWLPIGYPVGSLLSDYHGVIVKTGLNWSIEELLHGCGLKIWTFNHLIASQTPFQSFCQRRDESPVIDLSGGFEKYYNYQSAGSAWIQKTRRNIKRIERDIGPLRFQTHSIDPSLLQLLINWKSNQYVCTGANDIFQVNWIVELLSVIHKIQSTSFGSCLSVLYAGDEVAALHLGMRSKSVWHYWFPSYNQRLRKYFPGLILLLKMTESAEALGLQTIDLGKGGESYKQQVMNNSIPLIEGSAELPSLFSIVTRIHPAVSKAKQLARKTIDVAVPSKIAALYSSK